MKIWLLDSGSLVIDQAHITWNLGCGNPVRFPVYSVLIQHDEGLFLFDSGYDLEHVKAVLPFELPEQTPEQTIPAQLALCGFRPSDVTTLVMSHLHFDHVGGNKLLPDARVLVHAKEIAQARNCEPFEHFGYSDHGWDHPDAKLVPITGDQEIAKGLHLFETPGHTLGHYSLLVTPEGGRAMLFPFDVTYTQDAWDRTLQPGFHIDPVAGVRAIRRVKALAEEHDAQVFFTHDMDAWGTYRHAPDFYEV
ncbi:MAG: N-acyl homoserine lactonase family protein [Thermoleophilia bacterium]